MEEGGDWEACGEAAGEGESGGEVAEAGEEVEGDGLRAEGGGEEGEGRGPTEEGEEKRAVRLGEEKGVDGGLGRVGGSEGVEGDTATEKFEGLLGEDDVVGSERRLRHRRDQPLRNPRRNPAFRRSLNQFLQQGLR